MSRKSRRRRMRDAQGPTQQDGFDFLDDRESRTVVAPAPATPLGSRALPPAPVRAVRVPAPVPAPTPAPAVVESVAPSTAPDAPMASSPLTITVELPASFGAGPADSGVVAGAAEEAAVATAVAEPGAAAPDVDAVAVAVETPAVPLPTVGEMLIAAREARGLSLEAASGRTRISAKMLQHLEADRFGEFAADAYARGTLRAYGVFLHVDLTELLSRYDAVAGRPIAAAPAAPLPEVRVLQAESPPRPRARTSRAPWLDRRAGLAVAAVVVLVGAGAAGFAAWQHGSVLRPQAGLNQIESELRQSQSEPAAAPAPLPGAATVRTGEDTAPVAPAAEVPAPIAAGAGTDRAALPVTDLLEPVAAPVPPPAPSNPPANGAPGAAAVPADGSLVLTATASGPCTVRLSADAPRVRSLPFNFTQRGETRSWTARKSFRLVARRGANLQLTLNGRPVPTPADGRAVTLDRFTLEPKVAPAVRRSRPKPRAKAAAPAPVPVFESHGGMLPPY